LKRKDRLEASGYHQGMRRTCSSVRAFASVGLAGLISISCGPRLAPRIQLPADYQQRAAEFEAAYTAYWWNCTIVKSINLAAQCPTACSGASPAAACSAGASDAQNQIAELEKKYGQERTREILSRRVGEDDGHSKLGSHFPYGPKPGTDN
jgi:hypothetical protein